MSNLVTTVFKVKANKKALKKLSLIKKNIKDSESFADELGEDMDTGAKWANFVDVDNDIVSLESGNHLPDIAIKNLYRVLCEFDPNVEFIDGEYWEQNYIEVGVFVIDEDGFRFVSTSIDDVDIEEEFAFETYVNPVLEKLKKDL
jgi:hypothetical protein